jgi:pimeloyl-ACP methyl ester carboxylesterase
VSATEEGFINISDVRLEYRRIGNNAVDSPTLVLLHEGLGSTAMWKTFPEQLHETTGLNAFIYSRQAYGKSSAATLPREADYMHREALDVLPKVLDAANIKIPIFVGHSDGASIALIYSGASKLPQALALILMAPHVFNEALSVKSIQVAKLDYEQSDLRERLGAYHDDVDNAFWGWNDIWLHDDFRDWNIEEYLSKISVPVLHIQGEDDEYGTEAQALSIKTQCSGPVELLMLDNCAHSPFRDQREATLESISRFINQHVHRGQA